MGGLFDVENLKKERESLESETKKNNIWDDVKYAEKIFQQLKRINKNY